MMNERRVQNALMHVSRLPALAEQVALDLMTTEPAVGLPEQTVPRLTSAAVALARLRLEVEQAEHIVHCALDVEREELEAER